MAAKIRICRGCGREDAELVEVSAWGRTCNVCVRTRRGSGRLRAAAAEEAETLVSAGRAPVPASTGGTVTDPRPDELLERCGRLFWRVDAALAWTDGIADDAEAKTCSRSGRAAWKAARPLSEHIGTEDMAAGYFKDRARRRNPAVVGSASRWDLVEYDGDRDELDRKHGVPRLPDSLGWRSRRGPHLVYLAPADEDP